jgi:ribonuclease D
MRGRAPLRRTVIDVGNATTERADGESPTDGAAIVAPDADAAPAPVPLTQPRDGVPTPLTTPEELAAAVAALRASDGERLPIAIDAERASGYRYGQRAYLVQLRREDVGTMLFDPVYLPDLSSLGAVIAEDEWVLHAASQDLPCLSEVGLHATRVFDTELAGRLLGYAKVGLGSIVEEVLGLSLEKGHSAADWSTRPLPEPWIRYAALDVEVLVELRDYLAAQLDETGKRGWAEQEFAAIVAAQPAGPRVDPWRRTSGMHRVRRRRDLAVVRALWERRDELAQQRDISPGRVLPDLAIVEAALAGPTTDAELIKLPLWGGRSLRRQGATWLPAIASATALPESALPEVKARHEGPPPARSWGERDPAAATRLSAARATVVEIAERHHLPVENLLSPDALRRVMWEPPAPADEQAIADALTARGARPWQVALTAAAIAAALPDPAAPAMPDSPAAVPEAPEAP